MSGVEAADPPDADLAAAAPPEEEPEDPSRSSGPAA